MKSHSTLLFVLLWTVFVFFVMNASLLVALQGFFLSVGGIATINYLFEAVPVTYNYCRAWLDARHEKED